MTVSKPAPALEHRLDGLDALRGIAACVVAFGYHATEMFDRQYAAVAGGPICDWIHRFGWAFVDLFFVLSGFVFAHVYLPRADTLRHADGQLEFWWARFARLYPLHLLMLLIMALLNGGRGDNSIAAFIAHLLMLQALLPSAGYTFNWPAWSLSVEVVCYLLFSLALYRGELALRRLTVAAVAIGLVGIIADTGSLPLADNARGLLGFFVGQMLWRNRARAMRLPTTALWSIVMIGLIVSYWVLPVSASGVLPLTLAAWPALLLLALRLPLFKAPVLTWLGDRSYGIYLVHLPIVWIIDGICAGRGADPLVFYGSYMAAVVCSLYLADLAYRTIELPARSWLRGIGVRRSTAQPALSIPGAPQN